MEKFYDNAKTLKPIWTTAGLGTKDPGDPELRDYDPGHPWYYLLGGRPLAPEEICPVSTTPDPFYLSYNKIPAIKDPAKKRVRLIELQKQAEKSLAAEIKKYLEMLAPGYEVQGSDRNFGYGLESGLSLTHNHICSFKRQHITFCKELEKDGTLIADEEFWENFMADRKAGKHKEFPVKEPKRGEQLNLF